MLLPSTSAPNRLDEGSCWVEPVAWESRPTERDNFMYIGGGAVLLILIIIVIVLLLR